MASNPPMYQSFSLPLDHRDTYEGDDETRECEFILTTKPLQGLMESTDIHKHHWALVAFFRKGNKYMLFEIGGETSETDSKSSAFHKIVPYLSYGTWPYDPAIQLFNFKNISIEISPKKLLELARSNPLNGQTYSATLLNCQDWVKKFLAMISPLLGTAIEEKKSEDLQRGRRQATRANWGDYRQLCYVHLTCTWQSKQLMLSWFWVI